ncbi:MAG: amidohydrolase family protein [Bryobacteraceae bacterium]
MLSRVVLALCAVALPFRAAPSVILIRHVNVVDVVAGRVLPDRFVLLAGKKIDRVETADIPAPPGAVVVDGTHKYLMPGLWDMHVHLWYKENLFPLYLAWGVTGVRDMGSDPVRTKGWQHAVEQGTLPGPHVVTCGKPFNGVPSDDPKLPVMMPRSPEEAREIYDRVDKEGVDFIKVLTRLPADSYFALCDRGRKWGLPVVGHVPDEVSVWDAIDARQKSMEHLMGVALACSREENQLRRLLLDSERQNDPAKRLEYSRRVLDTYDPARAEKLFQRMAVFDSWQTPTLVMWSRTYNLDGAERFGNLELRRIPQAVRADWPAPPGAAMLPDTVALIQRVWDLYLAMVGRMQADGVPLLAGTDTGDPWSYPGAELHQELELLVKAGLTPAQALRTATINAAKFLDADDSFGSVQPGRLADLVLLSADPLADIRNTRRIDGVFAGGVYLSRQKLDALVAALPK